MFLALLCGTLALGAGLLAAAGYSEGTVVAARTAALTIGWLLLVATLVGMQGVRRRRPAEHATTVVVFVSGIGVLYLCYFHWAQLPQPAVRLADGPIVHEPARETELVAEPLVASAIVVIPRVVAQVTSAPRFAARTGEWRWPTASAPCDGDGRSAAPGRRRATTAPAQSQSGKRLTAVPFPAPPH